MICYNNLLPHDWKHPYVYDFSCNQCDAKDSAIDRPRHTLLPDIDRLLGISIWANRNDWHWSTQRKVCGIVRNYWTFPMERMVKMLQSLTESSSYASIALSHCLGICYTNQLIHNFAMKIRPGIIAPKRLIISLNSLEPVKKGIILNAICRDWVSTHWKSIQLSTLCPE